MTSEMIDAGDGLPLTIPALLHQQAAVRGASPYVVCDDDVLTYAGAEQRSAELARGLLAMGAGKGTHVGLLQPNGSDFVVGWLAAARIGAVTLPFSTFSTSGELQGLLANADVEMLLSAASYRSHDYPATLRAVVPELDAAGPLLSSAVPRLRHVWFSPPVDGVDEQRTTAALIDAGRAIDPEVLQAAEADVAPGDRMVIVHTSGSTSAPKGVIHTHGALIRHLDNLNEIRSFTSDEVMFSNSPFFWVGGFAFAVLGTLVAGARLVCSNSASASDVLDVIERERPTLVNGFAQSVAHLPDDPTFAARDLSSIRRGNLWPIMPPAVRPADPELRHGMLGMTETGSVCLLSADESDQPEHRRGSFGHAAPGLETKVVDPDDQSPCATGEVGELCFRGPFVMEGYYGRERHEVFDADGWFHTGDLVSIDADGLFYFKGRHGEMIKTAGANVSPREVEQAIADATGLVSHVVGLDDEARGQLVAAAVVVPEGREVDVDELRARLGEQLSVYKVPRRVVLLGASEVPMMSSGKLDLPALKALFDDR
jgi:acyl-CoA synthetase (AMP-forming)/AMP-acid ligase II